MTELAISTTNALSLRDSKAGQSMKATLRYLAGLAGPSGFGSNSTAEQVTQDCSSLLPSNLTALITGKLPYNNNIMNKVTYHGFSSIDIVVYQINSITL